MKQARTRILLLPIAALGAAIASAQAPPRPVDGVMLLSSDEKVVQRLEKDFRFGMAFEDLKAKFKEDRFVVAEWGKRSAIVIDKELGPLATAKNKAALTEELIAKLDSDGTVRIGALSEGARDILKSLVPEIDDVPDGFNLLDGAIGVSMILNFTIASPTTAPIPPPSNGFRITASGRREPVPASPPPSSITQKLRLTNEQDQRRNEALDKRPIPQRERKSGETAPYAAKMWADALLRDHVGLYLSGVASRNLAEGMLQASAIVDKLHKDLRARQEDSARELLKKLGMKATESGQSLPTGDAKLGDLPEDLRKEFAEGFANSWQGHGFASREDAEAFLFNATSFRVSTSISLDYCRRPRNPVTRAPGYSNGTVITTFSGGPP